MRVTLLTFDHGEAVVPLASHMARHARTQLIIPEDQLRDGGEVADDVQVHTFHKPRLRQPLRQLRTIRWILRRIGDFDPDVVHVQQGHLWFNWALPLLRRRALVVTVHDPRPHPGDRGTKKTPGVVLDIGFRAADQLIVHADDVKRRLVQGWNRHDADVHVIPLAFGDRAPVTARDPDDGYTVLFFGRIWRYKGLRYLIAAEPRISECIPELRIVIAGTGESFEPYRAMMAHPERFEVINTFVPIEQRDELFARAHVVVLPYIEATQTGVVPLAYGAGRPVVATTVGGLPEVIEDGQTGLLVPPGDVAALAEALIRLADPDTRRRMGRRAREAFSTLFDVDAIAAQTYAVYERALADPTGTWVRRGHRQRRQRRRTSAAR